MPGITRLRQLAVPTRSSWVSGRAGYLCVGRNRRTWAAVDCERNHLLSCSVRRSWEKFRADAALLQPVLVTIAPASSIDNKVIWFMVNAIGPGFRQCFHKPAEKNNVKRWFEQFKFDQFVWIWCHGVKSALPIGLLSVKNMITESFQARPYRRLINCPPSTETRRATSQSPVHFPIPVIWMKSVFRLQKQLKFRVICVFS